ncbi:ribbon-helix-helix domain-containing protein [Urechidicola croceus]|uniref:Uncharacterized protein n=1 Tax=Urechidicola croceus TaxID=1850246 RepID=A0A1D8P7P8_9FLAO|nr:CopG family transcriptional regulator [Urechidicola croceus]AOW20593.1 hypothetical protein LPB138_07840 [Urechidicola croceus]
MKSKITIRISDILRDQLNEKAQVEGVSTSELTRSILEEHCNSTERFESENFIENEQEIQEESEVFIENEQEIQVESENFFEKEYYALLDQFECLYEENEEFESSDIVRSVEFLQLVCWIYYQRSGFKILLSDEKYKKFQNTIIKIHSSKILGGELKNEFNKVFADLVGVEGNFFHQNSQLNFSKGILPKFNYSLLNNFIFKKNCGIIKVNI